VGTVCAERLVAELSPPGGMVKQKACKEAGAWRHKMGAPGGDGQRGAWRRGGVRQAVMV